MAHRPSPLRSVLSLIFVSCRFFSPTSNHYIQVISLIFQVEMNDGITKWLTLCPKNGQKTNDEYKKKCMKNSQSKCVFSSSNRLTTPTSTYFIVNTKHALGWLSHIPLKTAFIYLCLKCPLLDRNDPESPKSEDACGFFPLSSI